MSSPAPQVMRSTSPSRVRKTSLPFPPSSVSPTWSPGPVTSARAMAHSTSFAVAADRRVDAAVGEDDVVAGAAVLNVVALAAGHEIVAAVARGVVVAGAARDAVAGVPAAQRVVALAAEDAVEGGHVAAAGCVADDRVVPGPPTRTSLPWTPEIASLPNPPKTRSLPRPPTSWSLPPRPRMRSLPALPSMTSGAFVPRSRSLPGPPVMVAASAVARGQRCESDEGPQRDFAYVHGDEDHRRPGGVPPPSQGPLTHHEESVRAPRARAPVRHPAGMRRRIALLLVVVLAGVVPAVAHAADLVGTDGADRLVGSRADDRIRGRAGDDTLYGRAGADALFGDAGKDRLFGGPGGDTLLGGAGDDRLNGGAGADILIGGAGNDVIRARDGVRDRISCGPGRDRVIADAERPGRRRLRGRRAWLRTSAAPLVLLVDDDAAIRRTVTAGLELEGFRIVGASGGRAALEAAERVRPAAILLDLAMPDLDGTEVLRQLRERGDPVPVCVLSARDQVDDRVSALQGGADDYVVKPFALEEVAARLHALLRRRPGGHRRGPARGRPAARPPRTQRAPRRARPRAHRPGVRPPGAAHAQPRRGARPAAAARGGLGLHVRPGDERRRRLRRLPAAQARGGRGAARAAHRARDRVRPASLRRA